MNFALIGIGKWGQNYIKTLKSIEGAKLVATCSKSRESYNNLPAELKIAPHFTNMHEMLKQSKIDCVIIATHPDSHVGISMLALWYEKKVLCEKPAIFNSIDYSILKGMSERSIFYTGYTNLHHSIIKSMKFLRDEGSPVTLKLVNTGNGPVRKQYSDIWDYGSHVASVLLTLYPDTNCFVKKIDLDEYGNRIVKIENTDLNFTGVFGNRSPKRVHSFEMSNGQHSIFWENDKSEQPLKVMIEKLIAGKLVTNLDLSMKIDALLSGCERE